MVAATTNPADIQQWHIPFARRELLRFASKAKGRRLRNRVDFARDCVVIPEGPFQDEHWRPHFQPYTYHVLHLMDTAGFRKFRFTGCVQSGKTFIVVINILWHLFERVETVIYGVPDIQGTAADKWREELLPVIERSPFMRQFLPSKGQGSRGGTPQAIQFTNGVTLRFMGANGGDHLRSHYTAPVVVKTEVDRYDESTEASRESPPVEQMEARTEAFGDQAFSYEECTVTTLAGRIWSELEKSTCTGLYVKCCHCSDYVLPSRDCFRGVEAATDVDEAARTGTFFCPSCQASWTDDERMAMITVEGILPVHRGQSVEVDDNGVGRIVGVCPSTDKLGVSWNAYHNRFWSTAKIARDEWNAIFSKHPDEAELKRRQFAWALPALPTEFELIPLSVEMLSRRTRELPIKVVPPDTKWMSCGVDARQTQLHYVVRAWTEREGIVEGHAIDIGIMNVDSENLGVRLGLLDALQRFRDDRILQGYFDQDGKKYVPNWTLVDAGWQERIIWEFMYDCAVKKIRGFMPVLGRGQSQPPGRGAYTHPDRVNERVPWIGEYCYIRHSEKYAQEFADAGVSTAPMFVIANSDEWKSFVRQGYTTPPGRPGALMSFKETTAEEQKMMNEYRRQITIESLHRKVVPRRGVVDIWRNDGNKPNHLGDADYYSCVAGNLAGVYVVVSRRMPGDSKEKEKPLARMTMPDGRAYMDVATV